MWVEGFVVLSPDNMITSCIIEVAYICIDSTLRKFQSITELFDMVLTHDHWIWTAPWYVISCRSLVRGYDMSQSI